MRSLKRDAYKIIFDLRGALIREGPFLERGTKKREYGTLITKDYNFLLGRIYFTSNNGSQSTFVYKRTLDDLEFKKGKGTDYVLSWKSKGIFNSKLKPLYTAFLNSTKPLEYRIGIKFGKEPLGVEQNNYLAKIVNV